MIAYRTGACRVSSGVSGKPLLGRARRANRHEIDAAARECGFVALVEQGVAVFDDASCGLRAAEPLGKTFGPGPQIIARPYRIRPTDLLPGHTADPTDIAADLMITRAPQRRAVDAGGDHFAEDGLARRDGVGVEILRVVARRELQKFLQRDLARARLAYLADDEVIVVAPLISHRIGPAVAPRNRAAWPGMQHRRLHRPPGGPRTASRSPSPRYPRRWRAPPPAATPRRRPESRPEVH